MKIVRRIAAGIAALLLYVAASSAFAAPSATVTMHMVDADGRATTITQEVDPATLDFVAGPSDSATQSFDPPGAPAQPSPPSGPEVPPEATRYDIHQESNGWQRDTRFEREVRYENGLPSPSPWRVVRDFLEFVGCAKIPASCSQG